MIRAILHILEGSIKAVGFVLIISVGMLLAAYIVAGIAFGGNWHTVNHAVEKAYDKFLE